MAVGGCTPLEAELNLIAFKLVQDISFRTQYEFNGHWIYIVQNLIMGQEIQSSFMRIPVSICR